MFDVAAEERAAAQLARIVELQRQINQLTAEQLTAIAEFVHDYTAPADPSVPGGERARWGRSANSLRPRSPASSG